MSGWETLLTDPGGEQFDRRSEMLASIEAYSKAVPSTASAPTTRYAADHGGPVTDDDVSRMNARIGAYAGTGKPPLPDGIDWFERTQEPKLTPTSDPLARFVISRIIELETEPRNEIRPLYDQPGGAMAHRYAKHVRADCVVFRRVVALYLEFREGAKGVVGREAGEADARVDGLEMALWALANRWSDHREFDEAWRLT